MNIDQLKAALNRFPADAGTAEVMLVIERKGRRDVELILGVGYMPIDDTMCAAIVGHSEIERKIKAGEMVAPKGYVSPPPDPRDEGERTETNEI